jgi:hypothetical protein
MSVALQASGAWAADEWRDRRVSPPVRIALFVSSFEHQDRADEARDRRDCGAHLEGCVGALEAGHQFPALLDLVIEDVFHLRRRGVVMGD